MGAESVTVCFTGNPNCGKTTLFNAYTGAGKKTANWPGVTVALSEGSLMHRGRLVHLVDTPGIYSLDPYTMEETVTRQCIRDQKADVIIHVADALLLERSLFLTMQLLAEGRPMVLALNMMDLVRERGMDIDTEGLSRLLGGIPVIPVSARRRTGLEELMDVAVEAARARRMGRRQQLFCIGSPLFCIQKPFCAQQMGLHMAMALLDPEAPGMARCLPGNSMTGPGQLAAACIRYRGSPAQNKRNTDPSVGRVLDSFTDRADRLLAHPVGGSLYFWIWPWYFF